jgi:hypothetical protein
MTINRHSWPRIWKALQRHRLMRAEAALLECQRDETPLGGNVSDHDSRLLMLANEIHDFRRSYYEGGR